jgi:hypothetical protein
VENSAVAAVKKLQLIEDMQMQEIKLILQPPLPQSSLLQFSTYCKLRDVVEKQ